MKTKSIFIALILLQAGAAFSQPKLYFTDILGKKIQTSNPDGSNVETLVITGHYTEDIAIDTVRHKLYWTGYIYAEGGYIGVIGCADLNGANPRSVKRPGEYPRKIVIDYANNCLYWTDEVRRSIRKSNLELTEIQDLVKNINGIISIDLDPVNKKIYWSSYREDNIERADLNGANRELLFSPGENAGGIKLDLQNSKIYWTNNVQGKIFRGNLDGSNADTLVTGLGNVTVLDIDFQKQKIYWTESQRSKNKVSSRIAISDLDGRNVKSLINADSSSHFFGIRSVSLPSAKKSMDAPLETADNQAQSVGIPLQFDHKEFDFGRIEFGKTERHAFRFKNVGTTEATIRSVNTHWEYVTPYWPVEPIPPGGFGEVVVEYFAEGKMTDLYQVYVEVSGVRESIALTLWGDTYTPISAPSKPPAFPVYATYQTGDTLHVLAQSGLILRDAPTASGKKIATLPFGAPVTVLAENLRKTLHEVEAFPGFELAGYWVKVSTAKGKEGYVFDGFLSRFSAPKKYEAKEWLRDDLGLKAQYFQEGFPTLLNKQVFNDGTICRFFNISEEAKFYDFEIRFSAPMTLAEGWLLARALMFGQEKNRSMRQGKKIYIYPDKPEGRMIAVEMQNGQILVTSSMHQPEGCGH